jgi:hypothetical protein
MMARVTIAVWILAVVLAAVILWVTQARADSFDCTTWPENKPCSLKADTMVMGTGRMLSLAGEDPAGTLRTIKVDKDGYVIQPGTQMDREGRIKVSPCLGKMEAAMKAIKPYLVKPGKMTDQESNTYFLGKIEALLQWNKVELECWK